MTDATFLMQQVEDELSTFDEINVTGVIPLDLLIVIATACAWLGDHPDQAREGSRERVMRFAINCHDGMIGYPAIRRMIAAALASAGDG